MPKSVAEKLLMKMGQNNVVLDAPRGYIKSLGIAATTSFKTQADVIQIFLPSLSAARDKLPKLKRLLKPNTILWATYPKASGESTGINRDVLRELGETIGLRAVSLVAVDEKWSAMRFKQV